LKGICTLANISVPEEQNKSVSNQKQSAGLTSLEHWSFLNGYVVPVASLIIPLGFIMLVLALILPEFASSLRELGPLN
jgi:hypothetical protein